MACSRFRIRGGTNRMASSAVDARILVSFCSLTMFTSRSASRAVTKILRLNLPCYHPLAASLSRFGAHLHATFESGKELRSPQSSPPTTCWPASVAFQVVLILLGGCEGLAVLTGLFARWGPTEET